MRNYLAAAIMLGLLAGCSSHQDQAAAAAAAAGATTTADDAQAGDAGPLFTSRAPMASFASLPDRGELLAYEKSRQVKHKAAYTAYPVAISEAHALNAMRTGEMVINAPDGEQVRLTYERHEEGKDGNWTWIGRNADGASAVITFGEKAVFGVIPQGATETLRLTMSAGQSWLVQTDRNRLAGMGGEPRREGGDHLIPPKFAGSAAKAASTPSMQGAPATSGASASATVIDVLLGYTNGLASQLGSQSAAVTRLANMIAVTNEAYAQSGVNMRVRLVKAMQVTYPDDTDNGEALEELTGYKSGSGPITPAPAFDELREAREEVGADLVSLVRAFRTPENAGCGIAWLLGSDETGIDPDADAEFGYSVVSDGTDIDEEDDNTYYCREETLAHELGHNMGQAHNEEDTDGTGVHAYSYGYRESSSSGFYTVMAYPQADGNQFSIRYFANPNIKYDGRATGIADKSDNVRSMNLVMPIVAKFRATVVPLKQGARNDVDGDGKSDFLWLNAGTSRFAYWLMSGSVVRKKSSSSNIAGYDWTATGDFNGDGRGDVLWTHGAKLVMWIAKDDGFTKSEFTDLPGGWQIVGAADVDGDGRSDLLWNNPTTGRFAYWLMNGTNIRSKSASVNSSGYALSTTGDFNGDGYADLVWSNGNRVWLWQGNGSSFSAKLVGSQPAGWKIIGAVDVDGDGKSDLLWHNPPAGKFAFWLMNSNKATKKSASSNVSGYAMATTGDFNNDGYGDTVWVNGSRVWLWLGTGTTFAAQLVGAQPTGWTLH